MRPVEIVAVVSLAFLALAAAAPLPHTQQADVIL
jgi:hypothetical protein